MAAGKAAAARLRQAGRAGEEEDDLEDSATAFEDDLAEGESSAPLAVVSAVATPLPRRDSAARPMLQREGQISTHLFHVELPSESPLSCRVRARLTAHVRLSGRGRRLPRARGAAVEAAGRCRRDPCSSGAGGHEFVRSSRADCAARTSRGRAGGAAGGARGDTHRRQGRAREPHWPDRDAVAGRGPVCGLQPGRFERDAVFCACAVPPLPWPQPVRSALLRQMLPHTTRTLDYVMVPLTCGKLQLPRFSLSSSCSSAEWFASFHRAAFIVVKPRP